jgi:hypothetical protein
MHHFYLNRRDGSVFKTSTERIQGGGREPIHSRLLFTKSRAISQPPRPSASPVNSDDVWVNKKSGMYWKPGSPYYGKTKQGEYMSEKEAIMRNSFSNGCDITVKTSADLAKIIKSHVNFAAFNFIKITSLKSTPFTKVLLLPS